jgi:hypothetical protein
MNDEINTSAGGRAGSSAVSIKQAFIEVMFRPDAFFSAMPRSCGFRDPLIFMVVMGAAAGLVKAVLGLVGLGDMSTFMALAAIVITPVLVTIFGFVSAAVLYVIWRIMGSQQDFETAYRCAAYGSAISPATLLLLAIPYLGLVLGMAWWTLILVVASVRVHQIRRTVAVAVFGILALVFAVVGVGSEVTARHMAAELKQAQQQGGFGQGSPQEAGKMLQDMGKMLQNMNKSGQHPASGSGQ